MTESTFRSLKLRSMLPNRILKGADGSVLKVSRRVQVRLSSNRGVTTDTEAYVITGATSNLLGRNEIESLGLISIINSVSSDEVVTKFPSLFRGLGTLPETFTIQVKKDARPYCISVPRRIPVGLRDQVKNELKRMEDLGVISPVEKNTRWCAGIVVAPKKNGKVRICVDLSQLNKAVKRETFPLPIVEDALASLSGARVFSKMDANSGFWQIRLDEKSRELTTFTTPYLRQILF